MADQPSGGNTFQILRDIAARLGLDKQKKEEPAAAPIDSVETDLEQGRFQVLPSNALDEDFAKRASTAGKSAKNPKKNKLDDMAAEVRVTADNYRQMYLDQRVHEEAMTGEKEKEMQAAKAKALKDANKAAQEKKAADDYRYRARELQNKIGWWKQQSGLGQYDDSTINAAIDTLQGELGGIPQVYWP
ncbi:MAG: hypothetical protein PHY92_06475 [Alphaproteobacteria bacterium]|nr:hypothetical protein [Alphaproteobacteria bacterium]